jgi:tRNA threonylcarbamoyladenosine biosynthesis protein TsaB
LALDTATPSPSLALLRADEPVAELDLAPDRGAGRRVAEALHHLLGAAGCDVRDLGRVVVGVGPGGFTGLRIGIATALALGQALRVPVEGASTLEALAAGLAAVAAPDDLLVALVDARRGEVFAAAYRAGGPTGLTPVIAPAAFAPAGLLAVLREVADEPALAAGDGLAAFPPGEGASPLRPAPGERIHRVRAAELARRVRDAGPLPVVPLYLRLPDAEVNRLRRERAA